MKTQNFFMALCVALVCNMKAQMFPAMFNTGVDASYTSFEPYFNLDPRWKVAQTPDGWQSTPPPLGPAYVGAVSVPAVSGWFDPHTSSSFLNAGWITYPNTCDLNDPTNHGCLNNAGARHGVDQWYKLEFDLECCTGDLCINWNMWSDNTIVDVFINTLTTGAPGHWTNSPSQTSTFQGYQLINMVNVNFCSVFVPGMNYIIVHVKSHGPSTADHAGLLIRTTKVACTTVDPWSAGTGGTGDPWDGDSEGRPSASTSGQAVNDIQDQNPDNVLKQNVPNPFSDNTLIQYNIPDQSESARIIISNDNGEVVRKIEILQKGSGSAIVDANGLDNGIYSYRLEIDGMTVETKKLVKIE